MISTTRAVAFALLLSGAIASNSTVCWKGSYGRGVGKVIHACRKGYVKSGALCYPPCDDDATPKFHGVGPVCWQVVEIHVIRFFHSGSVRTENSRITVDIFKSVF